MPYADKDTAQSSIVRAWEMGGRNNVRGYKRDPNLSQDRKPIQNERPTGETLRQSHRNKPTAFKLFFM
jgi:hypothetical protein